MAVGGFTVDAPSSKAGDGKITLSVAITCIVAASCGLIFGYDIGISGCLLSYFLYVLLRDYSLSLCLICLIFNILYSTLKKKVRTN